MVACLGFTKSATDIQANYLDEAIGRFHTISFVDVLWLYNATIHKPQIPCTVIAVRPVLFAEI